MSDNEKAIRAAKLTLGAVLDKRRAKTAKDRAGGQIAPSKYLPDVPRQVHATGGAVGYVPLVGMQTPRLVTPAPPPPNPYISPMAAVSGMAQSANRLTDMFLPQAEEPAAEEPAPAPAQEPAAAPVQGTYAEGVSEAAARAMDALVASYGQPLEIVSSYRDRDRNREVGGADHSQHTHGNAFDIDTSHLTPEERVALARQAWDAGFRGFGFYDNNLHFDVGPARAWGPSYSYDSLPDWSHGFVQEYLPDTYARFGYADGGSVDAKARFLAGSKVRDYSSRTSSRDTRHNDEFPPLKVYHGTRAEFDAFRPSGEGTTTFMGIPVKHKRTGIFFSEDRDFSEGFANPPGSKKTGKVGAYHLNIQNPLHADEDGFVDPKDKERLKAVGMDPHFVEYYLGDPRSMWENFDGESGEWFVNKLKEAGYDGARFHEEDPDTGKLSATWVAFHPTQVKSAETNVGTYDPQDERFNYADGGEVADLGQAREQKQLQTYHTGMMDDVHQRMTQAMEAHQKAADQGVFNGYELGDTLQGSAGPMRITGLFMAPWKPTKMTMASFERMKAQPTVIEHEGRQYVPMMRYQTGREGDPDWQEGHAYLDGVRAAGYPKMGGLRTVKADGGSVYPMADRSEWYSDADMGATGGQIVHMSPDEYLSKVRPLDIDDASRDNIDDLKNHILSGRRLDPLKLYPDGKEDGRHRAHAARELGIKSVPVMVWPKRKADGGAAAAPMFQETHPELLENGKPMELYHGTPGEAFDRFRDDKIGSTRDMGFYGRGHYLTPDQDEAEGYITDEHGMPDGTVMGPLHAALKNPYVWDTSTEESRAKLAEDLNSMGLKRDKVEPWDIVRSHELDRFMGHMRKRGHDGVIVKSPDWQDAEGSRLREVVVFNPNMIKHRDAEVFDPNDPRIMRRDGGRS